MLSVLIPAYNTDCSNLIAALYEQSCLLDVNVEIVVMEDGSTLFVEANSKMCQQLTDKKTTVTIRHITLPRNIGRSAIRNRLGKEARHDWLIFMDCDSAIHNTAYLQNYLTAMLALDSSQHSTDDMPAPLCKEIICGGRIYMPRSAYPPECSLHHTIGSKREPLLHPDAAVRPFMSNNFAIRKDFFLTVGFSEEMNGYGHEDTRFGMEVLRRKGNVRYINNPVVHLGLDSNERFLTKYDESIRNLIHLDQTFLSPQESHSIRLLHTTHRLQRAGLLPLLKWVSPILLPAIRKQLKSTYPVTFLFDLYKILVISREMP